MLIGDFDAPALAGVAKIIAAREGDQDQTSTSLPPCFSICSSSLRQDTFKRIARVRPLTTRQNGGINHQRVLVLSHSAVTAAEEIRWKPEDMPDATVMPATSLAANHTDSPTEISIGHKGRTMRTNPPHQPRSDARVAKLPA
jgi:hypothetical protein